MEIALVGLALAAAPGAPQYPRRGEVPFDSSRRRMSTLHATPEGPVLFLKGAPEVVVERCHGMQCGDRTEPLTPAWRDRLAAAVDTMAGLGLRVLALAFRQVPATDDPARFEEELILAGLVGLADPPRPEVPRAIQRCREAGIKVIMVTGDHPQTAHAIAREIGLVRSASPVVIRGEQLQHLSDTQLQLALDAPEIVFARVRADQKMRIITVLKDKQEIVAVTGDGVNDAPALKKADIGIAMGLSGTDVARETADIILLDDNFAGIVAAIEEGRTVYANIRKFLTYILTSNIPELIPYLAFVLFRIPLPLTVIQILAVDLGTDLLPGLALGAGKPHPGVMNQPPRPRTKRLLTGALLLRGYGFLAIDYTPWGNLVFGTAPIPAAAWLIVLPFAAAMLALEEWRKWIVRRRHGIHHSLTESD